jgi:hypothetical protein
MAEGDFGDPVASAAQGISQGFQIGMAARQASWEKKYKQAAFAVDLASKKAVPASVRTQILNKGLLPLLNDPRFGMTKGGEPIKPFDEKSVDSSSFIDLTKKIKEIDADKDLTTGMKQKFHAQLISDYYAAQGEEDKALEVQNNLLKTDAENAATQDKQGKDLREEFLARPEIKDFQTISSAMGKIATSAKMGTPPGDMSLIYGYMKLLDPTSTVREGEYANAAQTTGIPGQIVLAYNKALKGDKLNDQQRTEFVTSAKSLYADTEKRYGEIHSQYFHPDTGVVARAGLDPNKYSIDLRSSRLNTPPAGAPAAPPQAPPTVGPEAPKTAADYLKKKGY